MKKHIPKKNSNTNVIRCILLNINERFCTEYTDYSIEKDLFDAMIGALVRNGIISLLDDNSPEKTDSYYISDVVKYNEWSNKGFYRPINDYIIPILNFGTELLKHIPVTVWMHNKKHNVNDAVL